MRPAKTSWKFLNFSIVRSLFEAIFSQDVGGKLTFGNISSPFKRDGKRERERQAGRAGQAGR